MEHSIFTFSDTFLTIYFSYIPYLILQLKNNLYKFTIMVVVFLTDINCRHAIFFYLHKNDYLTSYFVGDNFKLYFIFKCNVSVIRFNFHMCLNKA